MAVQILACGPGAEFILPFLIIGALMLIAVKGLFYWGFVNAFRFRVATPRPMSRSRVWTIVWVRTLVGGTVVGLTWLVLYVGPMADRPAIQITWAIATLERIVVWWILGTWLAKLEGRRLLGWTLSGTAIDVVSDATMYFTGEYGLVSPYLGIGAILGFIVTLYGIGRRTALLNRFTDDPLCNSCGYNLTGNESGRCPECGTLISAVIDHPPAAIPRVSEK